MGQSPPPGKQGSRTTPKESTPDRTIVVEINQSDWIFQSYSAGTIRRRRHAALLGMARSANIRVPAYHIRVQKSPARKSRAFPRICVQTA
jgi:hypothetical protein